jgi:hypothetical protein
MHTPDLEISTHTGRVKAWYQYMSRGPRFQLLGTVIPNNSTERKRSECVQRQLDKIYAVYYNIC